MICPRCSYDNSESANYCLQCGHDLHEPYVPGSEPPQPPAAPVSPPQPSAPAGPTTSGLAIAALVCAIIGPCFGLIPDVAAVILGILAITEIDASDGMKTGRGMAIAGIAVGVAMLLLAIAYTVIVFLLPAFCALAGNYPKG